MKLKIEIAFTDKYTNKHYKAGEIIEFDDGRSRELLSDERHLVSKVETVENTPKKPRTTKKK